MLGRDIEDILNSIEFTIEKHKLISFFDRKMVCIEEKRINISDRNTKTRLILGYKSDF